MRRCLGPIALVVLLAVSGCRGRAVEAPAVSWFPIGDEIHSGHGLAAAQRDVLALLPEPRWFVPFGDQQPAPLAFGPGPTTKGHPSLHLELRNGDRPDTIRFVMRLRAGARPLWRETEHRWTNTLPFLFAFRVDGNPVFRTLDGWGKFGGISRFRKVAAKGATRTWSVDVSRASLAALFGAQPPSVVEIVAVFSETQHEPWAGPDHARPLVDPQRALPVPVQPIVVRSNVARFVWR